MYILSSCQNLRALRFKSSYVFLKHPEIHAILNILQPHARQFTIIVPRNTHIETNQSKLNLFLNSDDLMLNNFETEDTNKEPP